MYAVALVQQLHAKLQAHPLPPLKQPRLQRLINILQLQLQLRVLHQLPQPRPLLLLPRGELIHGRLPRLRVLRAREEP